LDRSTVARYARLVAKPASNPAHGSESKPATNPTHGNPPGPASLCVSFAEQIMAAVQAGLSAQRIYQDLVRDHGFGGGYGSVKRFVRRITQRYALPFRRLECAAGDEMQIDFGGGAKTTTIGGAVRRPHLFRAVLSHSRKGYSEVVWRQDTESVIRCIENAFRAFGGVTATIVPDNLKAAVIQPDWFDPEINPKLRAFCAHYGTATLPTKPGIPRHKGKVEAGVKYVQNNAQRDRRHRHAIAAQRQSITPRLRAAHIDDVRQRRRRRAQLKKFLLPAVHHDPSAKFARAGFPTKSRGTKTCAPSCREVIRTVDNLSKPPFLLRLTGQKNMHNRTIVPAFVAGLRGRLSLVG
jgi:transposase